MGELAAIPGLAALWRLTKGDDRITVAVVDGMVDVTHPAFTGAKLTQLRDAWPGGGAAGRKAAHGTAVASLLFGRHGGPVPGMAPGCRAVSVPVFADGRRTSQLELARAIEVAADAGAHIINISGGQPADAREAEDVLVRAVRRCREQGVLIVAAAGNDGCLCDHVPAALDGVLAVGACDQAGQPLATSNFGPGSRRQGLLAPGQDLPVAVPGGGVARMSGTSLAAPVVSGTAALLACLRLRRGGKPDLLAIGELLRSTADPCDPGKSSDAACARHLNGTLNITKAVTAVTTTSATTSADPATLHDHRAPGVVPSCDEARQSGGRAQAGCDCSTDDTLVPTGAPWPASDSASAAERGPEPAPDDEELDAAPAAPARNRGVVTSTDLAESRRLVYALGSLGYDFGTEARRDTYKQLMPAVRVDGSSVPANPYDPRQMVAYLRDNPSEARPLIWTVNLDLTPIYAVEPVGGYAPGVYKRLTDFLDRQLRDADDAEFVDRVSIPGTLPGRVVRLFNGQYVPVIEVNLTRGLYGWSVTSLTRAVMDLAEPGNRRDQESLSEAVSDFLQRVYYDLRNFGATGQDRALNYAATNALQARETLAEALGRGMVLEDIEVEKSPYGRPDSDTWDVKLRFFDPENSRRAKRVYRFTIDVKDVLPVTVGQVRSWPEA